MNRYPLWKNLMLVAILLIGIIYSSPNLYGEDPAIQVSASSGAMLPEGIDIAIKQALDEHHFKYKAIESDESNLLVRFLDSHSQINAKEVIKALLGDKATVALNLAPVTPAWLDMIGAKPMKLGLDLRGGVHFLLEVDVDSAFARRLETFSSDIKSGFRENKLRWESFTTKPSAYSITMKFKDKETMDAAYKVIRKQQEGIDVTKNTNQNEFKVIATISPALLQEIRNYTVEQTMTTLRNRVNELGVAEAMVQRQGLTHVVVELPGIQDTARAKDILGKTATLEFHMADTDHDIRQALEGSAPPGSKLYYNKEGRPFLLKKRVILTGDSITGAYVGTDQQGLPSVNIRVGGGGLNLFKKATRKNIGKQMATVYIESKIDSELVGGQIVKKHRTKETMINIATIRSALGRDFQITGVGIQEAQDLSLLLRSGALPATITIVEERTVGPSLGHQNINKGLISLEV